MAAPPDLNAILAALGMPPAQPMMTLSRTDSPSRWTRPLDHTLADTAAAPVCAPAPASGHAPGLPWRNAQRSSAWHARFQLPTADQLGQPRS
jgi:hypothetical protein